MNAFFLLQLQATSSAAAETAQLGAWFVIILVLYAALYVRLFFWPVLREGSDRSFGESRNALRRKLAEGITTSEKGAEATLVSDLVRKKERLESELDHIQGAIQRYSDGRGHNAQEVDASDNEWEDGWADENAESRETRSDLASKDASRLKGLPLEDLLSLQQYKEEELRNVEAELAQEAERDEERAKEKLIHVPVLEAEYSNEMVGQAMKSLASAFPTPAFRNVSIYDTPSYQSYAAKASAAKKMAGVFVLLGLTGTMIKLDGVVATITELTGDTSIEPQVFLDQMGELMNGMGAAFLNSILGVSLMIFFLVLVSVVHRVALAKIYKVEHVLCYEVIPFLSDYQERLKPELSLAEIVNSTGKQLRQLDRSVVQMTTGMSSSLAGLGERIRTMLEEFGTFQKQYSMINDWVGTLRESTERMKDAADKLRDSGERVRAPIDEVNETLRDFMDKQVRYENIEVVESLLSDLRTDVEGLNQAHLQRLDATLAHQQDQMDKSGRVLEEVTKAAVGLSDAAQVLRKSSPVQTQEALRMLTSTMMQLRSTIADISPSGRKEKSLLIRSLQAAAAVVVLAGVVGAAAYGGGRLAGMASGIETIALEHKVVGDSLEVTLHNSTDERLNAAVVEFFATGSGNPQGVSATETVLLPGIQPEGNHTIKMLVPIQIRTAPRFLVRAIPLRGYSNVGP